MNWTIDNIEEQKFIRVRLSGDFSLNGVSRSLEDLFSRAYWKPGMPVLFDDTDLNLSKTSLEEIKQGSGVYAENSSHFGDGKVAVLAASVADFARGRQFELLTGNQVRANIRIFLKEEEAVSWLTA